MRIQSMNPPLLAFGLLLVTAASRGAPNATKSSFFPSSPIVDTTSGNTDPYKAEGSEFFPTNGGSKQMKFPGSQPQQQQQLQQPQFHPQPRQQSINSAEHVLQLQQQQRQAQSFQQDVILPLVTPSPTNEAEANDAIDVILQSARSGKSLNLQQGGDELVKVASDPIIKEQLASGNEAEARGYIRNKLCSLGLMPVTFTYKL